MTSIIGDWLRGTFM